MRICYFIHITGTDTGISGIPRVVKNLGRQLAASGRFEFIPVCWSVADQAVIHAPQRHLNNFAHRGGPELQESAAAGEPVLMQPTDWLLFAEVPHLHSYDPEYPSIPIIDPIGYTRRFGAKTAAILHDILPLSHRGSAELGREFLDIVAGGGGDDGELDRLKFTVYAQAMTNIDVVLPVSQTSGTILADWLLAHGCAAERLPLIHPILLPEEIPGIARVPPRPVARASGLNPIEFLTVGTVCAHKNQLSAFMAFSRLVGRRPELNLRFHAVGTVAPDCAAPASLIAKRSDGRIRLHGHLPDATLRQLWSRTHASVFVSLAEGYGLPVAESMWHGRPCLCSSDGSIAEIARGGGCLTVDPRNLDEIEAAFETLATDREGYDDLLQELAQRPMKSWETYADEVAEQLGVERRPARSKGVRREDPRHSRSPQGDKTVQTSLFFSASDLEVPGAYVSGRADPIRRKGAIWFERAKDGDVDEDVLFFGPYIWLSPGRYDFRFEGELEGELELDFTAEEGKRKLGRATVSGFGNAVTIDVPDEVEKFEIVGRRTPRLERLIFRNAFAEYRSLADAPPKTDASAEVGLDSGPGGEAAIDTAAAGSPPTAPEPAVDAAAAGSPPAAPEPAVDAAAAGSLPTAPETAVDAAAAGSPPTAPEPAIDAAAAGSPPTVPETSAVHGDDLAAIRVPPAAVPTAARIVFIRHESGRAMRLPCVIAAQEMRVHDAFGPGARNRLRLAKNIAFDAAAHGEINELRLFFGPYLRLEPGDYSFFFHGELQGRLKLRLTQKFASETLLETVLSTFDQPVHLRLEAPAEKFEIIGDRTKDTRSMTLHAIEVTPAELCNQRVGVAESTATEPRAPAPREAPVAAREHEGMAPSSRRGWREKIPFPLRT